MMHVTNKDKSCEERTTIYPRSLQVFEMKLFGYPNNDYHEVHSLELCGVTVTANPGELWRIAEFFEQAAIYMEENGSDFEHEHLMDNQEGFDEDADIQIYNEALLQD